MQSDPLQYLCKMSQIVLCTFTFENLSTLKNNYFKTLTRLFFNGWLHFYLTNYFIVVSVTQVEYFKYFYQHWLCHCSEQSSTSGIPDPKRRRKTEDANTEEAWENRSEKQWRCEVWACCGWHASKDTTSEKVSCEIHEAVQSEDESQEAKKSLSGGHVCVLTPLLTCWC